MATDGQHHHNPSLVVTNETRGTQLVVDGRIARSVWSRGRGLLGTSSFVIGDGLLIEPCQSIHSFWMRYAFDAVFLDKQGRVVHLIPRMKPNRASRHVFSARSVLELPAGTIAESRTTHGDQLRWSLQTRSLGD